MLDTEDGACWILLLGAKSQQETQNKNISIICKSVDSEVTTMQTGSGRILTQSKQ